MTHAVRPKAETDEPYATVSRGGGRRRSRAPRSLRRPAGVLPVETGTSLGPAVRCVEALDLQAQLLYHFPF